MSAGFVQDYCYFTLVGGPAPGLGAIGLYARYGWPEELNAAAAEKKTRRHEHISVHNKTRIFHNYK